MSSQILVDAYEYKELLLDSVELEFLTEVLSDTPTDYAELIEGPEYDAAIASVHARFEE